MKTFVQKLTSKPAAKIIGFLWGFAEGIIFFIVPDVYILFVTLFSPRRGLLAWFYSILGSLLSVVVMWVAIYYLPLNVPELLVYLPGITPTLVTTVVHDTAQHGLPYTPFLVFGGVPLKLYTAASFSVGLSFLSVMLWTVFMRIVRIGPGYIIAFLLSTLAKKSIASYQTAWIVFYSGLWVIIYTFYYAKMGI